MHAPVAAPSRRDTRGVGEDGVQPGREQDEPEVRRLVLPVDVGVRDGEEDRERNERQRDQSDEERQRAPRTSSR
jgi:hypothetical protein